MRLGFVKTLSGQLSVLPAGLFALLVALSCLTGCQPAQDPMLALLDADVMKTRVDDLARTMDFVSSQRRFDQREFEDTVSGGLNRWSDYSADKLMSLEWSLDPLAGSVLEEWSSLPVVERMNDLTFGNTDAWYLQQVEWVHKVNQRVIASNQLAPFELYRLTAGNFKPTEDAKDAVNDLVKQLNPDLPDDQRVKLTQSLKLFDWIVRNVQLLPEANPASDDFDALRLNDSDSGAAAAGIRGTGYQRYPWQTLLFGRGDYIDRAKLFLVSLEQLGIPALMLGVDAGDQADTDADIVPWAVGVKIGEQVYLFDTKMGLPIPGTKAGQIATLKQVRADKEILKSLNLTVEESLADETDYWVTPDQVKQLTGLVYVSPEGVSKRIAALEARLTGEDRLPLVNQPSKVAAEFEIEGLECKPWTIAFQTHQFRLALREAIAKSSFDDVVAGRIQWYYNDEAYINDFPHYRTSRTRFIRGMFEQRENERGYNAIESFQQLMYRDETIDTLGTDKMAQRGLGILQEEGQSAAEFEAILASVQGRMRLVRRDAGFFLAQSHFDNGSVSTAANWLDRLRSKQDVKRWSDGIDYLLGRSLEGRKDYDRAIEVYRENETTQSHGNQIRARLLKAQLEQL